MQGGYKAAAMSGVKSATTAPPTSNSNGSGANTNNANNTNGIKKTNSKKKLIANDKGNSKANGGGNGDAPGASRTPPPGFAPPTTKPASVPNAWATPLPTVAAPAGFSDSQQRLLRHRALFVFRSLVGKAVDVTLVDASRYIGILDCIDPDDFSIVLKSTQRTHDAKKSESTTAFDNGSTVIFKRQQLAHMTAEGVVTYAEGAAGISGSKAPGFRTDTEISNRSHEHLYGRELESATSWLDPQLDTGDLEEPQRRKSGWNQFEANEKLFGVVSTFDENLYTTKLDKTKISNDKSREAERLAREIERETTGNFHLQEERGQAVHGDEDLDEEAKYSSVDRKQQTQTSPAARSTNAYVPPALRNASRPTSAGPTKPKPISPKTVMPVKPTAAAEATASTSVSTPASVNSATAAKAPTTSTPASAAAAVAPTPPPAATSAETAAPVSSPAGPTPASSADATSQPRKPISFSEAVTGRAAPRPSPILAPAAAPATTAAAAKASTKQDRKPSISPKNHPSPKPEKPTKPPSPAAGKKDQKATPAKSQADKKAMTNASDRKATETKTSDEAKGEKKVKSTKSEPPSKPAPTAAAPTADAAPTSESSSSATSAKKTTLNPKAKEFKLSAAASTFTPKFETSPVAPVQVASSPYRQPNAGHYGHMHPPPPHPAMAGMGYAPGPEEWMYDGMMLDDSEYAAAAAHAYMGYGMPMLPNPAMMQQPMYAPMMPPQQNVRMGRHGGGGGGGGGYGYNQPGMYNQQRGYYGQGGGPGVVPYQAAPGSAPGAAQPPFRRRQLMPPVTWTHRRLRRLSGRPQVPKIRMPH